MVLRVGRVWSNQRHKVRVIAGSLGGRNFDAPDNGRKTHPMSEKARGAIFNALGDIQGLTVFDPFAGSGALSIEALSRGARSALALDVDRHAYDAILKNIKSLGLRNSVKATKVAAGAWSDNNLDAVFDLVLLDPPFHDIQTDLLEKLANHTKPGGILVLSLPPNLAPELLSSLYVPLSTKNYGDIQLVFFRRIK